MAKANSILVRMVSTGLKKDGKTKTGYFKTTRRNPKNGKDKMRLKCFDPRAWNETAGRFGKHVEFEETKIK
ncbi:MAG: 50S ribosomal protein L33 [Legionellaceae bacterium]|nr:50S ribosomal protein L33 [Legionellaceae bacterium]